MAHLGWVSNYNLTVSPEFNYGATIQPAVTVAVVQNTENSTDVGASTINSFDYNIPIGPAKSKRMRLIFSYASTPSQTARLVLYNMGISGTPEGVRYLDER